MMMDDRDEQDDLFARFNAQKKPRASARKPDDYPSGPGHRHVPTSVAAAESVKAQVPFMHTRILSFLADCATYGAIYTEIANRCRLEVPTVCGRMVELVTAKKVRVSKRKRKTPSGRGARVYVHASFWNPEFDE